MTKSFQSVCFRFLSYLPFFAPMMTVTDISADSVTTGKWVYVSNDDEWEEEEDSNDSNDSLDQTVANPKIATVDTAPTSNTDTASSLQRGTFYDGRPQKGLKLWGNIDYLLFWTKDAPIPVPLITSTPMVLLPPPPPPPPPPRIPGAQPRASGLSGPSIQQAGAIGDPGTQVLYGNNDVDYGAQSGFRVALRTWFDDSKKFGLEASGLVLPKVLHTHRNDLSPTGTSNIGVPFINTTVTTSNIQGGWQSITTTGETALLIDPMGNNQFYGHITVRSTQEMWDCELNGLYNFSAIKNFHWSGLVGLLYLDLREELSLHFESIKNQTPPLTLIAVEINDHFTTHNGFFGGQIGAEGEWSRNWFFARAIGKVGLGSTYQSVYVNGSFSDPSPFIYTFFGVGPGGIFSQNTNMGKRHKCRFAVVPQGFLQLGVNVFKNLRFAVGYNIIYISSVVRPGKQIDRTVNETQAGANTNGVPGQLSGPARPAPQHKTSDFWAQGMNIGIEFRY